MKNIRRTSLLLAESFDAWRIIPRLVIVMYAYLVYELYVWFKNIPTYVEQKCDAALMKIFLDSGLDLDRVTELSCTVADVVGGPTTAQSAFVTTIIGLAAGIFGLYTATGRKWDRGLPADLNMSPTWSPGMPDRRIPREPIEDLNDFIDDGTGPMASGKPENKQKSNQPKVP